MILYNGGCTMIERNELLTNGEVTIEPDISNLPQCVEDVRKAVVSNIPGPPDPTDYHQLRGRLEAVRRKLPVLYRDAVVEPFLRALDQLGPEGFTDILIHDPRREGPAFLLFDIAQTILQNGEGYNADATDAFQEMVSDLYDGFLSAEDRARVKRPDLSMIPPLVKWGMPEFGPYTIPIDGTAQIGLKTGIVSLPPAHAQRGLLAWSSLGHETGGHDILHADTGLLEELADTVRAALLANNLGHDLAEYWANRIDETASDVLGILNLGPAAGIGLIGYFRGIRAAYSGIPALKNIGSESDVHPADILRGYLAAYAVGILQFDQANIWERLIETETDKDLTHIRLEGKVVGAEEAKLSAKIVAAAIMTTKLHTLENHSLDQIQNWRNRDESLTAQLRALLSTAGPLPEHLRSGFYAAHVVAAAVTGALVQHADIDMIFQRMKLLLKSMHDHNPSWGPLLVLHPGDIVRHRVYQED
ncbi:hypothetical protein [Paenibacillus alvei]|uniref:hypothetical protein n=2 Tax=Paenibacillus alvei TaxID=44250 RepID=UPI001F50985A|nr:hypothetical protein [Paenibacillus alvei]MCY9581443.1 hypothetical protein [Paenibacillus alvei]MCY9585549.1 hypothetical protein [Paenibacillus alvei]